MKSIIYKYEDMNTAANLINSLTLTGIKNFRIAAQLSDILDSGKIKNYEERVNVEKEEPE